MIGSMNQSNERFQFSSVYITTMPYLNDQHHQLRVLNLIENAVISRSYTVNALGACQFFAARRTRSKLQRFEEIEDTLLPLAGKSHDLLPGRRLNDDTVALHLRTCRRRS